MEKFDYVIVGSGPGGSVLANRLSADPSKRVLVLEGGGKDNHPFIHMPKGIGKMMVHPVLAWHFAVHRGKGANQPTSSWARGKTLGGSSSINGLMYIRGQPADYDAMAAETSDDWNWKSIGAAFKALEHHSLPPTETRGDKGPLHVTHYPQDGGDEQILKAALDAGKALGIPVEEDVNTPNNGEKIGYGVRTIFKGRRQSANVAFLKPIRRRKNLVVKTGALVDRVIFEGTTAVGVEAIINGRKERFDGKRILLCAGTLATPAILQRSGVGPADLLNRLGIPVVADRAEVGENMREHSSLVMQWRAKNTPTNNPRYRGIGAILSGIRYYLTHSGPLSNATFEVTGFFKTNDHVERANAQLLFAPHTVDFATGQIENKPGFMIASYPLRPRSKGQVYIESKDPAVLPKVVMDFFDDPEDRREQLELIRWLRNYVRTEPLGRYTDFEIRPGPQAVSDDEIIDAVNTLGTPGYHAASTCRMGKDDNSVVDPQTRVRGVQNLNVVDLSIAPFVIAGNTYGPVAAMAWRAAEIIKGLDA